MAVAWSRDEIFESRGESAIQEDCKRNNEVFHKIAADFCNTGFERSGKSAERK